MNPNEEPVVTANLVVTLIAALIILGVEFGLQVTEGQRIAILAVVGILAPFFAAWWARRKTTPLAAPTDEDGTPLVRADTHRPTRAAQEHEERTFHRP